jgi:hypothetical protein
MSDPQRGFYHFNRSWYADACRRSDIADEVTFGLYYDNGDNGCDGEMAMRWYPLRDDKPPSPRLECYSDAWRILNQFDDLIAALAVRDGQDITPKDFCELLKSLGFADLTKVAAEAQS